MPPPPESLSPSFLRATVILGVETLEAAQQEGLERLLEVRPGWFLERVSEEWSPVDLTERAVEAGTELVVAAGGDGTVSAVASTLAIARRKGIRQLPPFAVLPLGTANDFARTLGVYELEDAIAAIDSNELRVMDAIHTHFEDGSERVFVNVANGGLAWDINDILDDKQKETWGALAYARGALDAIDNRTVYRAAIQVDGELAERVEALTIAVCSGRSCGGGLRVAPTADIEDGLMEALVLRPVSPGALTSLAARMRLGAVEVDDALVRFRGTKITVACDPPMPFVFDGEPVDHPPVTFEIWPGVVRVLVGKSYRREIEMG